MDTFGLDEDEFQEPDDSITWVFQFTGTMICKILHERLICYSWVQCKWLLLNILLPVCELCCSGPFDRIGDISFRMNAHEDNVSWVVLWCCYLQDRNNKHVQLRSFFKIFETWLCLHVYFISFIGSHGVDLPTAWSLFSVQPNTALFEACCNEKIQQFDDSGSDEEVSANSRYIYCLLMN